MAIFLENYIHYTYENRDNPGAMSQMRISKERIWTNYVQKMNDIRATQGLQSVSSEQLLDVLNDFSSNGFIGSSLENALSSDSFWKSTQGSENIKKGQIAVDSILSTGTYMTDKYSTCVENANAKLEIVEDALQGMIEFLYQNQRDIVLNALRNYINIPLPPKILQWLDSRNLATSIDIPLTDKGNSNLQKIGQYYEQLKNIATGVSMPDQVEFSNIMAILAGCFRAVNGEDLFEAGVVHGANIALHTANQAIKDLNDFIDQHANGLIEDAYFHRVGSETQFNKNEIKPDIEAYYNKNGVTFVIGGSVKLRQSATVQSGKAIDLGSLEGGPVTLREVFLEAEVAGENVNSGEKELLETLAATYYGKDEKNQWIAFREAKFGGILNQASQTFENLKTFGLISIFFRKAFGSGGISRENGVGNLAGFILVNNRVVTAAQVYSKLLSNLKGSDSAFHISDPTQGRFINLHINKFVNLGTPYRFESDKKLERSGKMHEQMDTLLGTKMNITLNNFMNLFL